MFGVFVFGCVWMCYNFLGKVGYIKDGIKNDFFILIISIIFIIFYVGFIVVNKVKIILFCSIIIYWRNILNSYLCEEGYICLGFYFLLKFFESKFKD